MKKYILGMSAIVLAVGFSAFTSKSVPAKSAKVGEKYWFNPGVTTQDQSTVIFDTEANLESGICSGAGTACKDGYSSVTVSGNNYVASGSATSIFKL